MFNRKNRIENLDAYVEERLSDYLDGTLSPQEREIVEAQLAVSDRARASLESLRYTVNLLKQTPAPTLPRQFTLPVTSRAPARTSGWFVWGLRGVAIGAAASFVLLLTVTLLRQPLAMETANAPLAATQAQQPTVVALAPTNMPYSAPAPTAMPASQATSEVAPLMITEESAGTSEVILITETPSVEMRNAEASQPEPSTEVPAAPPAPQLAPTIAPIPSLEPPPPTEAFALEEEANTKRVSSSPTADASVNDSAVSAAASAAAGSTPTVNSPIIAAGLQEAPAATAEAQAESTSTAPSAEGVVVASELTVREGPGLEYPAIGSLQLGDKVRVRGRDAQADWLAIEFVQDLKTRFGWVGAALMDVSVPIETLLPITPQNLQELSGTPTGTEPLKGHETVTPTSSSPTEGIVPDVTPTPEAEATPAP